MSLVLLFFTVWYCAVHGCSHMQKKYTQHMRYMTWLVTGSKKQNVSMSTSTIEQVHTALLSQWPNQNVLSDCLNSDCLKWLGGKSGCLRSVGRLFQTWVQLHWRLCRWSWSTSDWREAYECQPSAVFWSACRWRGSSRQLVTGSVHRQCLVDHTRTGILNWTNFRTVRQRPKPNDILMISVQKKM